MKSMGKKILLGFFAEKQKVVVEVRPEPVP